MTLFSKTVGVLLALLIVSGGVSYAEAAVLRSGDTVSVPQDATVEGDFYAAGNKVSISGTVTGDVYVMGGVVTINGEVKGDVVVLGGSASVHGAVGDDVRVVGGSAVVANAVQGDVLVLGGSLEVLSTAKVAGEVLFYGGHATIEGEVSGAVHARAESLTVNAKVGSVDVVLERELQLGDAAVVAGDVVYQSALELSRNPGSVVEGKVTKKSREVAPQGFFTSHLTLWFVALFSALVSVLLFRDFFLRLFTQAIPHIGLCGSVGLGVLIIVPVAAGLLLLSVLGVLIGAILIATYVAVCIVAFIVVHVFVGAFLAKTLTKEFKVNWLWTGVGVVATQGALLVPIVGPLLVFVVFVVVVGMFSYHAYHTVYA